LIRALSTAEAAVVQVAQSHHGRPARADGDGIIETSTKILLFVPSFVLIYLARESIPIGINPWHEILYNARTEESFVAHNSPLAQKLSEVKERIAAAAAKARRDPAEVTLIAVTKYAAPEQIREIIQLGVGDLGESRVQQLLQRVPQINEFHQRLLQRGEGGPPRLRWHLIGHLQRNKVKQVLPLVSCIHSLDSLRLAEELDTQAAKTERKVPVMLQVNASEESQKHGVAVGAAVHLAEQIASMPNLQLVGLMTMAALNAEESAIRHTFARTREIFEEIRWNKIGGAAFKHLSMGMTHDYQWAIQEGATMVRIGSALFGEKPPGEEEEENA
jgi:pyridoxal phosphate enzyme (YggS family)